MKSIFLQGFLPTDYQGKQLEEIIKLALSSCGMLGSQESYNNSEPYNSACTIHKPSTADNLRDVKISCQSFSQTNPLFDIDYYVDTDSFIGQCLLLIAVSATILFFNIMYKKAIEMNMAMNNANNLNRLAPPNYDQAQSAHFKSSNHTDTILSIYGNPPPSYQSSKQQPSSNIQHSSLESTHIKNPSI